jgi:sarcosine oxidase subunit beta
MVSGDEARDICPYISQEVIGASWCPTDGHANPMMATLAYYKKARELGATFLSGVAVTGLGKRCGKIGEVTAADGTTFSADAVVLAANHYSRAIAATVGINVPLLPRRVEALVTEAMPPMFWQMLGTAEADFYGHQTNHGSFVFGGSSGEEMYAAVQDMPLCNPITAPCICRGIVKYFPMLEDAKIVRTWSGWLDMCIDEVPIIDSVAEVRVSCCPAAIPARIRHCAGGRARERRTGAREKNRASTSANCATTGYKAKA